MTPSCCYRLWYGKFPLYVPAFGRTTRENAIKCSFLGKVWNVLRNNSIKQFSKWKEFNPVLPRVCSHWYGETLDKWRRVNTDGHLSITRIYPDMRVRQLHNCGQQITAQCSLAAQELLSCILLIIWVYFMRAEATDNQVCLCSFVRKQCTHTHKNMFIKRVAKPTWIRNRITED